VLGLWQGWVLGCDLDQPVVFGDALTTGGGTGFDLAAAGGDDQVGDETVRGFTGTVGHHLLLASLLAHTHRLECFTDGADLVQFDQGGIADAISDRLGDDPVEVNQ